MKPGTGAARQGSYARPLKGGARAGLWAAAAAWTMASASFFFCLVRLVHLGLSQQELVHRAVGAQHERATCSERQGGAARVTCRAAVCVVATTTHR